MNKSISFVQGKVSDLHHGIIHNKSLVVQIAFILILALGMFLRVWEFNRVPPGLNQDEASLGLEAYNLYHFGVDRNGVSYPVYFISWGTGMDALEGYILVPFMILGLSAFTVRLPILISAILSLILVYDIARRTVDQTFGLLCMLLVSISPWHIILSRWGFNENIFPFVFLLGYWLLIKSKENNNWFILSCIVFAFCLYAYGSAYLAIPVFLGMAITILLINKRLDQRKLIMGLIAFFILITPILLFIFINIFELNSINIGPLTIPNLPLNPRMVATTVGSHSQLLQTVTTNIFALVRLLLLRQSDGQIWNTVEPYGYMYSFGSVFAVMGAALLVLEIIKLRNPEHLLLFSWLVAAAGTGLILVPNINRLSIIFIPIIVCIAICLYWIFQKQKFVFIVLIFFYMLNLAAFTRDYHGELYRQSANYYFYDGFLSALNYAHSQRGDQPICVTSRVREAYIFVLFVEKWNPADYLQKTDYFESAAQFFRFRSIGNYWFGINNCTGNPKMIYVLSKEKPADRSIKYSIKAFSNFRVYIPQR